MKESLIKHQRSSPYNPNNVKRAREMRKDMTSAEKRLWFDFLKGFKHRVYRQRPIHHYIVDFYCSKLKLAIEVDGDSHFTVDGIQYDTERTKALESLGIRVIRFTNKEVLSNFQGVCEKINSFVG
jgi:very-short-patch-repair endonuclease